MKSTVAEDATALVWVARLFLAIGVVSAVAGAGLAVRTTQFMSESIEAEGTVVAWTQGQGTAGASSEPGAYYRVVEIVSPHGQRIRGHAEVGVDMNQLQIGERLMVRYRPADPARMRVVSIPDMWLGELVTASLAIAFGTAGAFLLRQTKAGNDR